MLQSSLNFEFEILRNSVFSRFNQLYDFRISLILLNMSVVVIFVNLVLPIDGVLNKCKLVVVLRPNFAFLDPAKSMHRFHFQLLLIPAYFDCQFPRYLPVPRLTSFNLMNYLLELLLVMWRGCKFEPFLKHLKSYAKMGEHLFGYLVVDLVFFDYHLFNNGSVLIEFTVLESYSACLFQGREGSLEFRLNVLFNQGVEAAEVGEVEVAVGV